MDTLRWSRLSVVIRPTGSGRAPADVIRATAASALSAAAASSGLSCRASAMSSPTVDPGAVVLGAADTGSVSANAPRRPIMLDRSMAHSAALNVIFPVTVSGSPCTFGNSQEPTSSHDEICLEAIGAGFTSRNQRGRCRHCLHALRRHVDTRRENDCVTHRPTGGLMDKTYCNRHAVAFFHLGLHRLEAIVAGTRERGAGHADGSCENNPCDSELAIHGQAPHEPRIGVALTGSGAQPSEYPREPSGPHVVAQVG